LLAKAIVLVLSKEGSVFKSDLCRATLEEAIEQGIPIIPIYDSDITSPQHIKDLIEGDVDGQSYSNHTAITQQSYSTHTAIA
jgi:hypothetical protein